MEKKAHWLLKILKLFAAIALLALVIYKINLDSFKEAIKQLRLSTVAIILILLFISHSINSIRIWLYIKWYLNYNIKFWDNFKLYYASLVINNTFFGGIGGELYKVYYLKSVKKSNVVKMIFAEKINVLAATAFLIMACAFFLVPNAWYQLGVLMLSVIGYKIWILLECKTFNTAKLLSLLNLGIYLAVLIGFLTSFLYITYCLRLELNMQTIVTTSFLFLISNIITYVPISVGGAGLREWTFYYGAPFFQLNVELMVMAAIIFFTCNILLSLAGVSFFVGLNRNVNHQRNKK